MSIDTTLARLTAGLDEDDAIARAAGERSTEWRSDGKGVDGGPFTPADPEWGITESGEHTIVYDEGWPLAPEALHIARQDPKATVLRVEAIRKVIDWKRVHDELFAPLGDVTEVDRHYFERGVRAATELFIEILAGIYPEPTDETEPS